MKGHPLDTRREPSALEGWFLDVLYFDIKGSRTFSRIFVQGGEVFAYVGRSPNLRELEKFSEDLKDP